ncbi:MAG: hypothetical protein JXM79_09000 [Sedimentisphaerales bacterium]|nr:hypothetical protein [Sedimentisphaerales bacterium]
MSDVLAILVKGQWKPGIGDPTILGWVTTIGYFIASGLCGAYAIYERRTSDRGPRVFWWSLTVFMLLLGFNKQLDIQVLVLQIARQMSEEQGWFAERDVVRKWIILSFAFIGLVLMVWLGWTGRRVWLRYILAVAGIALLIFFVLIRASGNRLMILGYRPGRFPMYDILEVGGVVCVIVSALIELRRCRKKAM